MEVHRTRTRWTYAEFARLPSEGGARNEIISDELFVTPAPGTGHQRIVTKLTVALGGLARDHGLGHVLTGPVDVLFSEGDYLEPDLVFVTKGREDILTDRGIEQPPDLVVEVVSPSTEARDRGIKLERYRHYGVGEYWIIDPDRKVVEVWTPGTTEPRVAEKTLEWRVGDRTFKVSVEELFGS